MLTNSLANTPASEPPQPMDNMAKVFMNEGRQAIQLPTQFRFDVDKVYIRQDEVTGDVILSKRANTNDWSEFLQAQEALTEEDKVVLDEMMDELQAEREKARQLAKLTPQNDVFADWVE